MDEMIIKYPLGNGVKSVRTVSEGDEVFFALEDIVVVLASDNTSLSRELGRKGLGGLVNGAMEVLDDDEKRYFEVHSDGPREELFVTEPGLYRVVLQDSSPAAKRFQRWMMHDVLPAIRQYGTYPPPVKDGGSEIKSLARRLIDNTNLLIKEIEAREKLEREIDARFRANEKALMELEAQLASVSHDTTDLGVDAYMSIKDAADDRGLSQEKRQLLWAHSAKLCIEANRHSKKVGGVGQEDRHMFPRDIVEEALRIVLDN